MKDNIDWSEYYDTTRKNPPYELLVKAVSYVENVDKAIDIGGGSLRDTKYLLEKGFEVTVIDKSPLLADEIKKIDNKRLHHQVVSFEEFHFPTNEYVLVSAMYSLHYCEQEDFDQVIKNIKSSLKPGGIFCGQLLNEYNDWSKTLQRTYLTADQARSCFNDMDLLLFEEEETPEGRTKHWQIFNFIARKRLSK